MFSQAESSSWPILYCQLTMDCCPLVEQTTNLLSQLPENRTGLNLHLGPWEPFHYQNQMSWQAARIVLSFGNFMFINVSTEEKRESNLSRESWNSICHSLILFDVVDIMTTEQIVARIKIASISGGLERWLGRCKASDSVREGTPGEKKHWLRPQAYRTSSIH